MSKEPNADGHTESESCYDTDDDAKFSGHPIVPAYMSAVMRRQYLQEMLKNLPPKIQNRITVLKNMQLDQLKLEAEFFEEVYKLEKKYHEKYQPLFDIRKSILMGEVEPGQEEPRWKECEDHFEEDKEKSKEIAELMKEVKQIPEDAKGIPCFWLTIFRNTEILSEMVQEHDEPVLKKLNDIKITYNDEHSYTLEFHFDKNEYFSDAVLTKQYFLKADVDEVYPFGFEGPEIYKCKGCIINWEKKMNLTIKTIRKKQKHKERGSVRTIVKHVPNDSFFNFFNPPDQSDEKYDDEDSQGILATDFEVGHFLRARVIPKAILYFTGDIVDDDDDDDEFEDEEEDDGDETDEENNGGEHKNTTNKKKGGNPNECPNQ